MSFFFFFFFFVFGTLNFHSSYGLIAVDICHFLWINCLFLTNEVHSLVVFTSQRSSYFLFLIIYPSTGVLAEDLFYTSHTMKAAFNELDAPTQIERNRRVIRAHDLITKHAELPKNLQDYDPFVTYGLSEKMKVVHERELEEITYK